MYRRRIKKPPPQVFPDTLQGMGYSINQDGALIDESGKQYTFDLKAKNRPYQEAHGRALGDATMREMNKRMEQEFGLVRLKLPLGLEETDTTSPQADILLSPDAKNSNRLLVLVPGTLEPLGAWSRRLLCNRNVELGSVYSVVKQARDDGYGVVVLNPNSHWWVDGRATVTVPTKKDYKLIPGLGSPEEHVAYVLSNIVQNFASKEIFFIAHKYGAHALIQALYNQFDTYKDRVSAVAVIESTHTIDSFPTPEFKKWWSLNGAGYVHSEDTDKGKIEYKPNAGCNCVCAGSVEFDFTLVEKMPDIFRFFRSRNGRDNKFESYRDRLQTLNEDDPTTVMVTFEDENNAGSDAEEVPSY